MMAVMGVKRFCICCAVCALLLGTGIYPQNTGKTTVPPELQEKLDYVKDDKSDCTIEYIDALEEELCALYPADDYVFFRTNLRRGELYVLSGDYENGLKYLITAKSILKKHTAYDDADAAEIEAIYGSVFFYAGYPTEGLEHYRNVVAIEEKVYGPSSAELLEYCQSIAIAYYGIADYDTALEFFRKALGIAQTTLDEEHPDIGVYYQNIGHVYCDKGDYDNALKYCIKALDLWEKTLDEPNQYNPYIGLTYNTMGLAYCKKGDYDQSLKHFNKALEILREELGENDLNTINCYSNIGIVYKDKGDYDQALEYLGRILKIFKSQFGDDYPNTATAYNNIGDVYREQGDYESALKCFEHALEIRRKVPGDEAPDTAVSYNNIGLIYANKGDYDRALEYYGKALDIYKKAFDEKHSDIAVFYNNIGDVYSNKGDYGRALEYFEIALDIQKKISENHPSTAKDYNNIGLVYHKKGDYEQALKYYSMALDILKKMPGEEHPDTITVYNNIGRVYEAQGNYDLAQEYYGRALDICMKVNDEFHPNTAELYNSIGHAYKEQGAYADAMKFFNKSLTVYRKVLCDTHPSIGRVYDSIGEIYYEQGQYAEATSYWKKSWKSIQESKKYVESLEILKGQIFSDIPDTSFLSDTLSLAMDTVEKARLDMSSMKESITAVATPIYYYGVDFAAKDKKPQDAFEYSEALRSRGFLDQMGTEAALRLDGVTDGDRQRVQELVSRISAARAELERQGSMTKQERDEVRYKKAGDNLASAEKELALLDEEIGRRVPAYTQLRNPQPVNARQAQDWCGKRRAVLEYVLWSPDMNITVGTSTKNADIGSYCIVLTQKGVTAVRLDGDFDYAACIDRLRKKLTKTGRRVAGSRFGTERDKVSSRELEQQFEQERNDLYARLIAPVLSKLSGIEELVIVPDGSLSLLPFDILRPDADAGCLGDQYAVSFSPSVSVSVIADTHKKRSGSVLAFGGAWYDKNLNIEEHRRALRGSGTRGTSKGTDRGSLATDFELTAANEAQLASMRSHIREYGPGDYFRQKGLIWQDLPGTVAELDTLREYVFPPGSYDERMQKSASEAELKKLSSSGKLKDYSVLHLACHGYFDRNIADMSSVLFSEVSGKLRGRSQDDGYLTIPETAVLSLDADMVCLSACETGLGEVKRGDGMVGLSRAFMVAGADRVGVSLWCIDDKATAEFMTLMYQKVWPEGKSYSRAYREVKAEFRASEDFCHPYYWAAFVLYE